LRTIWSALSIRGGPESPLRWTSKSGPKLAEALLEMGRMLWIGCFAAVEAEGVQPAGEQEDP